MALETSPIDIAVLLPRIDDWDRTKVRYGGLAHELGELGLGIAFVEGHEGYQGEGVFTNGMLPIGARLGATDRYDRGHDISPRVVRDLTMPLVPMPLYEDPSASLLVHNPSINDFIRSKSQVYELLHEVQPYSIGRVLRRDVAEAVAAMPGTNVVVKPDTGSQSRGVMIGEKSDVVERAQNGATTDLFIVQEAIDMSRGLEEHGAPGVHNIRFIVIGGTAVYGFVRNEETGSLTMQGETFENRTFKAPEDFRESLTSVLARAQELFSVLPHSLQTVLAFDLIRGLNHEGEEREYLLELNRRPLRNSPYDGTDASTLWASHAWDVAEANMLQDALKS